MGVETKNLQKVRNASGIQRITYASKAYSIARAWELLQVYNTISGNGARFVHDTHLRKQDIFHSTGLGADTGLKLCIR